MNAILPDPAQVQRPVAVLGAAEQVNFDFATSPIGRARRLTSALASRRRLPAPITPTPGNEGFSVIYLVPTMTRPILALVFATAMCTLMGSCDRLHAVSGKYHQQDNPSETIILNDDGTCQRDNFACTYALKGNEITITMTMPTTGIVNGTIDGKRLTITEPNPAGGKNTTMFIRE